MKLANRKNKILTKVMIRITQTIQQAIYSVHDNPCGLNTLIFEEMGKTQIRYIDLKNYLDFILRAEESTNQWNIVREYAMVL